MVVLVLPHHVNLSNTKPTQRPTPPVLAVAPYRRGATARPRRAVAGRARSRLVFLWGLGLARNFFFSGRHFLPLQRTRSGLDFDVDMNCKCARKFGF